MAGQALLSVSAVRLAKLWDEIYTKGWKISGDVTTGWPAGLNVHDSSSGAIRITGPYFWCHSFTFQWLSPRTSYQR